MTRAGTTSSALLRIVGVLGLLVLVAVVVGVLQAMGWASAWGFYGPLAGSGLLWCVVIWRTRRDDPVSREGVREAQRLVELVREERSVPPQERSSRCGDGELDAAAGAAAEVLAGLERDRVGAAARTVLDLQARARREGWYLTSPLRRQLESVVEVVERADERRRRRTWWQRSMTQPR